MKRVVLLATFAAVVLYLATLGWLDQTIGELK